MWRARLEAVAIGPEPSDARATKINVCAPQTSVLSPAGLPLPPLFFWGGGGGEIVRVRACVCVWTWPHAPFRGSLDRAEGVVLFG